MQQQSTSGNQSLTQPRPEQLRALVLDYLCHSCYIHTAQALARDSAVQHLDRDGDEIPPPSRAGAAASPAHGLSDELVWSMTMRDRIRTCILGGRVDKAIALLNAHFPRVLDTSGELTEGGMDTPPAPDSSSGRDRATDKERDRDRDRDRDPDRLRYTATTVDPVHLALNLRILAFIEACRTVPLVYTPPLSSSSPAGARANTDADGLLSTAPPRLVPAQRRYQGHPDTDAGADIDLDPDAEHDMRQTELLIRAQKLYALVHALRRPTDRAEYQKELTNVGGLLAYPHPETSPIARYLAQERRERVAEQINGAILYYTGMPVVSCMELAVRHTHCLWSTLHALKAKLPPTSRWPAGVLPPPNQGPAKKELDEVPPFDLKHFLDMKL